MLMLSSHPYMPASGCSWYGVYGSVTSTNFLSLHHDGHHLLVLQHCHCHQFFPSYKDKSALDKTVCSGHISMWPSSSWPLFLLNYLKHLQCRGEVSIVVVTGPEHIPALSIITCSRLHFPCFHMSMLSQEVSPPSDSRSVSPADGPVGKFTSLKGYQKYLVRIVWMPPMETALYLDLI